MTKTYMVWDSDSDIGDAYKIQANDPEEAAEKWAEDVDVNTAEYAIVGQRRTPRVCVQEADGDIILRYLVDGEAVPTYRARLEGQQ